MPSVILTAASGSPFPIVSGNFWSGQGIYHPAGSVRLKLAPNASGNAYISLSGGGTVNSGGFLLSGVNTTDGYLLAPGDEVTYPKMAIAPSGTLNLYGTCDAGCSGQARLYWDMF